MLKNRFRTVNWADFIGGEKKKFELVSYDKQIPQTWDEYYQGRRKFFDADAEDKGRFQHYFGKENTEKNFLEETQIKYSSYVNYLSLLWGKFAIGEKIDVFHLSDYRHVIQFVKEDFNRDLFSLMVDDDYGLEIDTIRYRNIISFQEDKYRIKGLLARPDELYNIISIWLYEEVTAVLRTHIRYYCYAYFCGYDENECIKTYYKIFYTDNISFANGVLQIDDAVFKKV